MKQALISVFNKEGVEELAQGLLKLGFKIISTGGTAQFLKDKGLEVETVEERTGFPEILSGRVKTLHPKIMGAILALPEQKEELRNLGIEPIELVAVNLYPFRETVEKGAPLEEALENIDIGGVTLIRAACKNFPHVLLLTDPQDYPLALESLKGGEVPWSMRAEMALKGMRLTSLYDSLISHYLSTISGEKELPPSLSLPLEKIQDLRYGENPHQRGALYCHPLFSPFFQQIQGKELSFNNIQDAAAALSLLKEFEEPTAVSLKHAGPCGVASASQIREAFIKAKEADPVSIYGGIIGLNRKLDEETAQEISKEFLEVAIAPSFSPSALEILKKKKNLRLLLSQESESFPWELRQMDGGLFGLQDKDEANFSELHTVTDKAPSQEEWEDLLFAWKVVKHTRSNAIVVAKNKKTLGIGGGQPSRVSATKIALSTLNEQGAVLASDAFFPFPDSLELAHQAGVSAVIQPGGSIRDEEIIAYCNQVGIAMVFTGMRHFLHK